MCRRYDMHQSERLTVEMASVETHRHSVKTNPAINLDLAGQEERHRLSN